MSDIANFRYRTVEERLAESEQQLAAQAQREAEKMAYDREAVAQARMKEYDDKRAKWKSENSMPPLQSLGENVGGVYRDMGQMAPTNKPAASISEFWNRYNTWLNVGREQAAKNALDKQYITMTAPKDGVIATDANTGKRKLYQPGEKYKALASGKTPIFPGRPGSEYFTKHYRTFRSKTNSQLDEAGPSYEGAL
jgi:hypothetical protein